MKEHSPKEAENRGREDHSEDCESDGSDNGIPVGIDIADKDIEVCDHENKTDNEPNDCQDRCHDPAPTVYTFRVAVEVSDYSRRRCNHENENTNHADPGKPREQLRTGLKASHDERQQQHGFMQVRRFRSVMPTRLHAHGDEAVVVDELQQRAVDLLPDARSTPMPGDDMFALAHEPHSGHPMWVLLVAFAVSVGVGLGGTLLVSSLL